MAIIEFVKGAGENLDAKAEADLATALKQRVVETGVTVKFLAVIFDDGTAVVTGTVATHEDRNPSTILEYPTVAELVADIGVLEDLTSE